MQNFILWLKAFHVIFVVVWFSGLFYLPRLFVYHAMTTDAPGLARFKIMEYKLFYFITTPGAMLTTISGLWLLSERFELYRHQMWMHGKLILVMLLWIYHMMCGYFVYVFRQDRNRYSHIFYRYFNEFPTIILISVIILAIVQPGGS